MRYAYLLEVIMHYIKKLLFYLFIFTRGDLNFPPFSNFPKLGFNFNILLIINCQILLFMLIIILLYKLLLRTQPCEIEVLDNTSEVLVDFYVI